MQTIRIFISSPSDLTPERQTAVQVIERLHNEFKHFFDVKPVFWEHEPLLATEHFQEGLISPAECDLMVCMLWSRLGSPLPQKFDLSDEKNDGQTRSLTGTEWEFQKARQAFEHNGNPRIMFYRKTASVKIDINDAKAIKAAQSEKIAIDHFFDENFHNQDTGHTFKNAYWPFEALDEFESQLDTHLRNLLKELASEHRSGDSTEQPITWHKGSPFRGLRAFELEHATIFFGRSRARSQIFEQFQRQISAQKAFLMILGMSGSGKSSLVKAGVQPLLLSPKVIEGVAECRWAQFKPSDSPDDLIGGLARALFRSNALPESAPDEATQTVILKQIQQSPHALEAHIFSSLNFIKQSKDYRQQFQVKLLIVIDQFEELFTLPGITESDRQDLISLLHSLVSSGHSLVMCTMRSDFFAQCEAYPELIELMHGDGQYHLSPPTGEEIEQMIVNPARAAGINFAQNADGVRLSQVIRESSAKHPSALPLLSFTLDELYRRRNEQGSLTFEAYDELGGLEGAIANRAEDVFSQLDAKTQSAFKELLPSLVTIHAEESDTVTARSVNWSFVEQNPIRKKLVEKLINERLLVSQSQPDSLHNTTVRFTHEALLQNWKRVKDWVEFNLEQLKIRTRLASHARYWEASNKQPDELLTDGILFQQLLELSKTEKVDLSRLEKDFINASFENISAQKNIEKLKREKEAKFRKRLSWAAGFAAVFVMVFAYQIYSSQQSQAALKKVQASQSLRQKEYYNGQMIKLAQKELDQGQNRKALSWALKIKPQDNYSATYGQSRQILYKVLNRYPHLATVKGDYQLSANKSLLLPENIGGSPLSIPRATKLLPTNSDFTMQDHSNLEYLTDMHSSQMIVFDQNNYRLEAWSIEHKVLDWKWQARERLETSIYLKDKGSWLFLFADQQLIEINGETGRSKLLRTVGTNNDYLKQLQAVENSKQVALVEYKEDLIHSVRLIDENSTFSLISLLPPKYGQDTSISMNWEYPINLARVSKNIIMVNDAQGRLDLHDKTNGKFLDRLAANNQNELILWDDGVVYVNNQGKSFLWRAEEPQTMELLTLPYKSHLKILNKSDQRLYFINSVGGIASIGESTSIVDGQKRLVRIDVENITKPKDNTKIIQSNSSDERFAVLSDNKVVLYDTTEGRVVWQLNLSEPVKSMEFNQRYVVLKGKRDRVVDLNSTKSIWLDKAEIKLVTYQLEQGIAYSVSNSDQIQRINLQTGRVELTHQAFNPIDKLVSLKNGIIMTGSKSRFDFWQTDGRVNLFERDIVALGKNFVLSNDRQVAAFIQEQSLHIVDPENSKLLYHIDLPGNVTDLKFSGGNDILYILSAQRTFSAFSLKTGKLKEQFQLEQSVERFKLFQEENKIALFGTENTLELRELSSGDPIHVFTHWAKPENSFLAGNNNDILVTLTDDNTFNFWSVKTGTFLNRTAVNGTAEIAIGDAHKVTFITRYSRNETQLYDPVANRVLGSVPFSKNKIRSIKVSPSSSAVALLLKSNTLKVIRLDIDDISGEVTVLKQIQSVANVEDYFFSENGGSVTYRNNQVKARDSKNIHRIQVNDFSTNTITHTEDIISLKGATLNGRQVVVESQRHYRDKEGETKSTPKRTAYLDIATGKEITSPTEREFSDEFIEHIEWRSIKAIALAQLTFADKSITYQPLPEVFLTRDIIHINPKQQLVVTKGVDNLTAVWDINTSKLVAEFIGKETLRDAYTTPDGKKLVIANDKLFSIHQLYPEPLVEYAKKRLLD